VLSEEQPKPGGGSLVILVEDDRELAGDIRADLELAGDIRADLEAEGHAVHVAETVTEGLRGARAGGAALLIVNRMLHGLVAVLTDGRRGANASRRRYALRGYPKASPHERIPIAAARPAPRP
jgi:hypothetical protein